MLNKIELRKLRRSIPHGGLKQITDRLNDKGIKTSYAEVVDVFRGKYYRDYVITEAVAVAKEAKQSEAKEGNKAKKLIDSI